MLEFALVLMVQRNLEVKRKRNENYSKGKVSEMKSKQKISDLNAAKDFFAGGESTHESDEQDEKIRKIIRLSSLQLSTDNIDMMACILFLASYVIFNLFYWM